MKKKILSFVLVLSMLCAFMPVIAVAETSGTCGDNVTWTLDQNGTLTISGAGDMENSAFYNNNNIKSVIIENGVTIAGAPAKIVGLHSSRPYLNKRLFENNLRK